VLLAMSLIANIVFVVVVIVCARKRTHTNFPLQPALHLLRTVLLLFVKTDVIGSGCAHVGNTVYQEMPAPVHYIERRMVTGNTRKLSYRKDDRAMRRMYGRPENFQKSMTTHTATFPEFLMGFCSD